MKRLPRLITVLVLVGLMVGFGFGVNRYFASRQTHAFDPPKAPTAVKPAFSLPGSIYVAQQGGLFAFKGTKIVQLQATGQGWTQPVLMPDGSGLLAVKVTPRLYSDLFLLGLDGTVKQQLTHNAASSNPNGVLGGNHWIFYPRVGPDGKLYFSYDKPKAPPHNDYEVDFSIWNAPMDGFGGKQMQQVTSANWYTGGDVSPVPLAGGGILYAKYNVAPDKSYSQIRIRPTVRNDGDILTQPADNCASPTLSPDQSTLAMVCSPSSSQSDLVLASFDAKAGLGPLRRVVTGTLVASPAWAPDGTSLLYVAPATPTGYFQLWYLDKAQLAKPAPPRPLTTDLDLDATSAPSWSPH